MPRRYVHTCLRILDPDASVRFYGALGFEERGRLNFETAYNIYLGLPEDGDVLELTVNRERDEPYDVGDGYNHMAITVEDIHAALFDLEHLGVAPEKPPYHPGGREDLPLTAFVADPDGYRIELVDGGGFPTPQDPPG
jgi:lactoylglutathione lyase